MEWMEAILPGSSKDLQKFASTLPKFHTKPTSPPILATLPCRQENPYSLASPEPMEHAAINGSFSYPLIHQAQNYLEPNVTDRGVENQVSCAKNSSLSAVCKSRISHSINAAPGAFKNGTPRTETSGTGVFTSGNPELVLRHRQTFTYSHRENNVPQLVRSMTEREKVKSPVQLYEFDQGMEAIQTQMKSLPANGCPPNTSGTPELSLDNIRQRQSLAHKEVNRGQFYELDPGMEAIQRQMKSPPSGRPPLNARPLNRSQTPQNIPSNAQLHSRRHPPQLGENSSFDSLFPPENQKAGNTYMTLLDTELSSQKESVYEIPQHEQGCQGISLSQSLNLPRTPNLVSLQCISRGKGGEEITGSPYQSPTSISKPVPTRRNVNEQGGEEITESPYQSPTSISKPVPTQRNVKERYSEKITESRYQSPTSILKPVPMRRNVNERGGEEITESPYQSPTGSLRPMPKARKKKLPVQPFYMEVLPDDGSNVDIDNSSDLCAFGLKPEVVKNLNTDQLEMLRKMLRQTSKSQSPPSESVDVALASTTQLNGSSGKRDGPTDTREWHEFCEWSQDHGHLDSRF